ncbi:MAG: nucleotidyltransferase domain-containing protein [Candidatus Nanoarchaeia archaeon]
MVEKKPVTEKKLPIPTRREELRKISIEEKDYKIAYDFAASVYKKFGPVVLSIVLFGSAAKGKARPESDIDIIIIVDNVSMVWDEEVIAWYREELFKLVKANPHKDLLHINTVTLSAFWENVRAGDPAIINMLRYGVALVDLGFFEPLKYLLLQGRIRPTAEAVYTVMMRVPWHLLRARVKNLSAIEDLYWAAVDSAHAALMVRNKTPPSPEHIAEFLTEVFVKPRKLSKQYVDWFSELHMLAHDIKNHKVHRISGEDCERWYRRVVDFTKIMERLTKEGEQEFLKKQ